MPNCDCSGKWQGTKANISTTPDNSVATYYKDRHLARVTGTVVRRTRSYEYGTNNSSTATLVNESWASVDGPLSWSMSSGLTNLSTTTMDQGAGTRTVVATAPDGSTTTTSYSYSRPTSVIRKNASSVQMGPSTYSYDIASRLDTVTDGTYSATYAYLPNSSLLDTATFKQSRTTRMTTQRQYDYLNRLPSIANTPSGAGQLPASYAYLYNDANQRTRMALGDGSYWVYEYDALGQVKTGKHYWSDNSPIPGQQFEYGFDDIGNRSSTKSGGDATGQNLRSATYTANALNQYTQRTIPGGFDILGLATAANSVTVNGSPADYRRGEYFQESVATTNTTASLWQSVTVIAGTATNTGNQYVAQTPESLTFDLDGNTTQDGHWTYTWDGENRLIALESLGSAPDGSKRKLQFEYDWMGRRIGKKVYIYSSGYPGTPNTTLKFLYDGWNLMAELDGTNGNVRTYQWGLDLSDSLQGAGGVGGLPTVKPTSGIAQFQGYDGNGNVMLSVDGSNGTQSAEFEYGPFGETLRASGAYASVCLNRFSTKYQDNDSSFYYYGYRYYDPSTGRWPNRGPIGETGGLINVAFSANDPIDSFDMLGLAPRSCYVIAYGFSQWVWSETCARDILNGTISEWMANGYTFAANDLTHWLRTRGRQPYFMWPNEIEAVRNSKEYRGEFTAYLLRKGASIYQRKCVGSEKIAGEHVRIGANSDPGSFAFRARYEYFGPNPDLFYALAGASFGLDGIVGVDCFTRTVLHVGAVFLKDPYAFPYTGWDSCKSAFLAYNAAAYLQNIGCQAHLTLGAWGEGFSGIKLF